MLGSERAAADEDAATDSGATQSASEPRTHRQTQIERLLVVLSRWRIELGGMLGLAVVLTARPTGTSIVAGLPLLLAGLLLRGWARGILHRDLRLATGGPYAWVRHPMYAGSFLAGLAVALMARRPWLVPLYVVTFAAMYVPKLLREEAHLRRKFGAAFDIYCTRVARLVPTAWPRREAVRAEVFSWRRWLACREWQAWLTAAVLLAYFWAVASGLPWIGRR